MKIYQYFCTKYKEMSTQNKAQLRYHILDNCFRDTSAEYTLKELLETVNIRLQKTEHPHKVSERQLYSDIAFMKSPEGYGAEIESYRVVRPDRKGDKRVYSAYRYKDPSYSISKIPLTYNQMRYVQLFLSSFDSTVDPDMTPWIKKTINGMKRWLGNFDAKPAFRSDVHGFQGGVRMRECFEYFRQLLEAIDEKKSMWMLVRVGQEDVIMNYHPFFLKQFYNRWYVLGVTTENPDKIQPVPLDRIYGLNNGYDPYINYPFNPDEYFDDFVGVFDPGGECCDVHLRIRGWGKMYFSTNPMHASQRSKFITVNGEEVLDVHMVLKINEELKHSLNAIMDCVDVIAPQELVDYQNETVKQAAEHLGLIK